MAADYKKLLIRYVDKVIFVAFLVLFLYVAFKVVMSGPEEGTGVPPMPKPPNRPVPVVHKQRFVLNRFQKPPEPSVTDDFTSDPEKVQPGPLEKQCPSCGWIVPKGAAFCAHCGYRWAGIAPPPDNTKKKKDDLPQVEGIPFVVRDISYKAVDILFSGLAKRVDKPSNPIRKGEYELQINWGLNTRTAFVPLGGWFHGYALFPLEIKEETIELPGGLTQKRSVYYLTIKKPGGRPLIVAERKTVTEDEPVASFEVRDESKWKIRHRGLPIKSPATTFDVYAQYELEEMGGQGRKFTIVDVRQKEVILQDKAGKKHTLRTG